MALLDVLVRSVLWVGGESCVRADKYITAAYTLVLFFVESYELVTNKIDFQNHG